ncbi:MAG TPA: dihydrodipicolinate synthase family protein [Thermodesulfobacteriota bacterium]|nr:dihydrodipicolinate synthase family protein [Thermodesulfobacteriota bacterium]
MTREKSAHREKLSGVFAPMTTPFDDQGKILLDKMALNVQKLNGSRLRGYLVLGTNGEFRSLSTPESMDLLRTVVKTASPDKVIMAGTGGESTSVSIELCHQAAEVGAHYGSLITPFFFAKKMSDSALINHFIQVAERSPIPVLLYNNPGVTGITLSAGVIKEVSSHPKIVGMKDSSPGNLSAYILNAQPGFYLLAGSANFFFTGLLMGAVGGVLSLADAFPERCCKLYDLGVAQNLEEGRELQFHLMKINQMVSGKYGVAGVKAAMDFTGFYGGPTRAPLASLTADEKKKLREGLVGAGLLKEQ